MAETERPSRPADGGPGERVGHAVEQVGQVVEQAGQAVGQAVDDIGAYIRSQREGAQVSMRQLARAAGVSNPYLSQIERGLRKPSAEILQQIAKALRISAETLYVRAGILEERDANQDLEGEILRDAYLTEDQKQTLIKVYWSFRHENEDRQVSPVPEAEDDTLEPLPDEVREESTTG